MRFMEKPKFLSQAMSILLLPFNATVTIPLILLLFGEEKGLKLSLVSSRDILIITAGVAVASTGIFLLAVTIRLFIVIGRGTLAPWKPAQKLVVKGPYRYARNPMISGVSLILAGEAILFRSYNLLAWLIVFLLINHIYFVLVEEPGLAKRFGEEYEIYKQNVPRWLPRLTPWERKD
ncbi:MAG TPA: isoprenylcysteine carboxylmethyltransferase family protein [Bacillota bacterium]|jgi:protein-S-isoprenylcysteine O-methyltransferase Ste14|nr:isoprenylcysteine carboxylmethyltransferase family protein [Bacillota bacterium]